jgi:hypothetical protein
VGKRGRRRAARDPSGSSDAGTDPGPFIELGLPPNAEPAEISLGTMGIPLELRTGQVGGAITELGRNPGGGVSVTVGRPLNKRARELVSEGAASAAVTVAHSASEAYVRFVVEVWSRARGEGVPEQVRSFAFHSGNKVLTSAYEALSGDLAWRQAAFWTTGRVAASIRRRNRILHAGYVCSEEEAAETIETLDELHRHMEARLEAAGLQIGGPRRRS